jgi:hypothetical protein
MSTTSTSSAARRISSTAPHGDARGAAARLPHEPDHRSSGRQHDGPNAEPTDSPTDSTLNGARSGGTITDVQWTLRRATYSPSSPRLALTSTTGELSQGGAGTAVAHPHSVNSPTGHHGSTSDCRIPGRAFPYSGGRGATHQPLAGKLPSVKGDMGNLLRNILSCRLLPFQPQLMTPA